MGLEQPLLAEPVSLTPFKVVLCLSGQVIACCKRGRKGSKRMAKNLLHLKLSTFGDDHHLCKQIAISMEYCLVAFALLHLFRFIMITDGL